MDNLTTLNEYSYIDVDDIARALRDISGAPSTTIGGLIDAIYQLKAIAQNPYNNDYYRILYNVLEMIADKNA